MNSSDMGRKRKSGEKLPKYVYLKKGRYVHVVYKNGKVISERRLASGNATIAEVWAAYERLSGEPTKTLKWLSDEYQKSVDFNSLSPRSRSDYRAYSESILNRVTSDGPFGERPYSDFTRTTVERYKDVRGKEAPTRADREIAYLSIIFNWGVRMGYVDANPCSGVRKIKPKTKAQYVDDDRNREVFQLALESGSWYLAPMMVVAVVCRARRCEILDLKKDDLLPQGIFWRRRKGSNDNIIRWNNALRWAINYALSRKRKMLTTYVFADASGQPIRDEAFKSAWTRLMTRAEAAGIKRYWFHDLKRKGVSDDPSDWMAGSGHRSPAMGSVYRLRPLEADAVDFFGNVPKIDGEVSEP